MKGLEIHLVRNKDELRAVSRLRKTVFVREQKVPLDLEMDEFDRLRQDSIQGYLKIC